MGGHVAQLGERLRLPGVLLKRSLCTGKGARLPTGSLSGVSVNIIQTESGLLMIPYACLPKLGLN